MPALLAAASRARGQGKAPCRGGMVRGACCTYWGLIADSGWGSENLLCPQAALFARRKRLPRGSYKTSAGRGSLFSLALRLVECGCPLLLPRRASSTHGTVLLTLTSSNRTIFKMTSHLFIVFAFAVMLTTGYAAPVNSNDQDASEDSTNVEINHQKTQRWLIESVSRLQKELNEVAASYAGHLDSSELNAQQQQRSFVNDVAALRADHTILAKQQEQIIQLIKNHAFNRDSSEERNQKDSSAAQTTSTVSPPRASAKHRKHGRRLHRKLEEEKKFEKTATRNITELFGEVSALHDITIALFHDLQDLEKRAAEKTPEESAPRTD